LSFILKYSSFDELSRKIFTPALKLPVEIASVFKPKLKICVRNGAFLGEIPKTTLQEEVLT